APHSRRRGGFDQLRHGGRVHRTVGGGRQAGFPVERRDVVDHFAAGDGTGQIGRCREIAFDDLHASAQVVGQAGGAAREHPDTVARVGEMSGEMTTGEAGGASHENLHRSATTVTGDPKTRSAPSAASTRSQASVAPNRSIRLCRAIGRTNWRRTSTMRNPPAANASLTSRTDSTRYASTFSPRANLRRRTT